MTLILPTAVMLEMLWVPELQVESPRVINTPKNYVAVHTRQLVSVNILGITINNNFPGRVVCCVVYASTL